MSALGSDDHFLRLRADFKYGVGPRHASRLNFDRTRVCLQPDKTHSDGICLRVHTRDREFPLSIRNQRNLSWLKHNSCALEDATARIDYATGYGAFGPLRKSHRGKEKFEEYKENKKRFYAEALRNHGRIPHFRTKDDCLHPVLCDSGFP